MTAQVWMEKANRNLKSAELLLTNEDPEAACNRAYYAIFNAARAALWVSGKPERAMAKTHSGMIAAFSEHLVKAGHIDVKHGSNFGSESKRRMLSDYGGGVLSADNAKEAIANATAFLSAVKQWISTQP
jgi:uncharacterized protein (UPF0332 family)